MPKDELEKIDDFTKPSRQKQGGKRRKNQSNEVRVPKEPYRRQRFSMNDVDDLEEDY